MITDKIFPCFYIIDVQGEACKTIMPGDFDIDRISATSLNFATDIQALGSLELVIDFITLPDNLDRNNATESVEYNPEFFPSLKPLVISEQQQQEIEALELEIEAVKNDTAYNGKTLIPVSRIFDPIGDFVESRWIITADNYKILGRIAINPDLYMAEKHYDMVTLANAISSTPQHTAIH